MFGRKSRRLMRRKAKKAASNARGGARVLRAIEVIVVVVYFFDWYFDWSYRLVSPFMSWSNDLWYSMLFIMINWGGTTTRQHWRETKQRGVVTVDGIVLVKKNTVIPLKVIDKVAVGQEGVVTVHTADDEVEVFLMERDIVRLAKVGFNSWSIEKKTADIARAPAGEGLTVAYKPTGKYSASSVVLWGVLAAGAGVVLLVWQDVLPFESCVALPLLFMFWFCFENYKEVEVTIDRGGVTLKDKNLAEHYIAFTEMRKVEKGFFRMRLAAKDGRTILLPPALYLMPEFVGEYAGLQSR